MNKHPGILGKKLGMTQLFEEDGTVQSCTVIQGGCVVVDKRTEERDGYSALVLGLDERKEKHASKAVVTAYQKRGQTPKRFVKELRCSAEYAAGYEIGSEVRVEDLFEPGQFVDVQARSKGSGFTGVMKRHNFSGSKASHGVHENKRHAGSIGMATTPGRVLKGHKMAGQHGNATMSVLNLKVVKVVPERQLVLVRGGVPGPAKGVVLLRGAVKKRGGKPKQTG